jgi:hypothetical protein
MQPEIVSLLQRIVRTLNLLLVPGLATASGAAFQCAYAQTVASTQPAAANAAPNSQAKPNTADPKIDKSQIAQRLNRELDFNLETTTGGATCVGPR